MWIVDTFFFKDIFLVCCNCKRYWRVHLCYCYGA